MSQEKLQTMIMRNFWGVKEVYYGIVQVVNIRADRVCLSRTYTTHCYPSIATVTLYVHSRGPVFVKHDS